MTWVFSRGEFLPEFERVTLKLQPGQVSGLVRTQLGFHIIKITGRKTGSVIPYEDVTEKVRNQYYEEESKRLYEVWLKKVKVESFIEVKL